LETLNYHHLLHFWVVAREGGLVPAGKALRVTHSTLSAQIRSLEAALGEPLFHRTGRRLVLSEAGSVAFRYADDIFGLGRELVESVRDAGELPVRLHVGIADVVPKLVVRRLLEPALAQKPPVRLVCHEGTHAQLLADLALHKLHVVLADAPVPPGSTVRAYHHLLGESGVSFFGTPALVRAHRRGFPHSLDGAPFLLPLEDQPLRRMLNHWFDRHRIRPSVVAELEDSALAKVLGADGLGFFPAPTVVEREVVEQYGVQRLGRAPEVKERFYAITAERRVESPAVVAIRDAARHELFRRRA